MIDKIIGTMRELGTGYRYLIVGYPPFLKLLLDEGEAIGFDVGRLRDARAAWRRGQSESLRDYLLRRFRTVFRGYGATDIEIGLAAETPVCIGSAPPGRPNARRSPRPCSASPAAARWSSSTTRCSTTSRRTTNGELLFTVTRHATLAPKVRYNVHDEGGVIRDDERRAPARGVRIRPEDLAPDARPPRAHAVPLRLRPQGLDRLGHGREHLPADIEAGHLRRARAGRARVLSFCLGIREERPARRARSLVDPAGPRASPSAGLTDALAARSSGSSRRRTADYQEAMTEYPALMVPIVDCSRAAAPARSPATRERIKHRYVGSYRRGSGYHRAC